jgi:hypothetical protein
MDFAEFIRHQICQDNVSITFNVAEVTGLITMTFIGDDSGRTWEVSGNTLVQIVPPPDDDRPRDDRRDGD